jgi:hypothetical protein
MSMGTDTSAGSGVAGGGGSLASGASQVGSGGLREQIMQWIQDPETRKALASMITSGGKFAEDMGNAPKHVQDMMAHVIGGGGHPTQQPSNDPINPYGGDMAKFITPEMAKSVLAAHGIPFGG